MKTTSRKLLVVVDGEETDAAVVEAGIERAERGGATLVVAHVLPEGTYEERRRGLARVGQLRSDGYAYTFDGAVASATALAERVARETIGDRDVAFEAIGGPGDRVGSVRSIAAAYDCSAVLLAEDRSWLGRAFGRDRRLRKGFDGAIVRVPRPAASPDDYAAPAESAH